MTARPAAPSPLPPAAVPAARRPRRRPAAPRAGFTLIEMLISVTLVLLMMALFAQVFGLATETVSARKGMAANDQKSRLLSDRMGKDVRARTFVDVVPFGGAAFDYQALDTNGDPVSVSGLAFDRWGGVQEQYDVSGVARPVYQTTDVTAGSGAPLLRATVTETSSADYEPGRRLGYFSISENDPANDRDDRWSFTIDVRNRTRRGDIDNTQALGRAALLDTNAGLYRVTGAAIEPDQPATDVLNVQNPGPSETVGSSPLATSGAGTAALAAAGGVGTSSYAVVTYYLRGTNLIRSRELIREPPTGTTDSIFDLDDTDGETAPDDWPPAAVSPQSFRAHFDYAAFRHPDPSQLGPRLHDASSLDNLTGGELLGASAGNDAFGGPLYYERLPKALGVPHLRTGAGVLPFDLFGASGGPTTARSFGRPREFTLKTLGPALSLGAGGPASPEWAGLPIGQYTVREQSSPAFDLPGVGVGTRANHPYFKPDLLDADANGTRDRTLADVAPWFEPPSPPYPRRGSALRRGEEILVTNVHSFDVEVFDDAIGDFVDLGHNRFVAVPDSFDVDGDGDVAELLPVAGDYHRDRLVTRTPTGTAALDLDGDGAPALAVHPFGNRFDTWHPGMRLMGRGYVDDGSGTATPVAVERPYPPPYRPLRSPFGGNAGVPVNDFAGNRIGVDQTFGTTGLVFDPQTGETTTPALLAAFNLPDTDPGHIDQLPLHRGAGDAAVDDDGNGYSDVLEAAGVRVPDPNEIGYLGSDAEKPLRAVRITVRYYDVGSDRMREESFRYSLVD